MLSSIRQDTQHCVRSKVRQTQNMKSQQNRLIEQDSLVKADSKTKVTKADKQIGKMATE